MQWIKAASPVRFPRLQQTVFAFLIWGVQRGLRSEPKHPSSPAKNRRGPHGAFGRAWHGGAHGWAGLWGDGDRPCWGLGDCWGWNGGLGRVWGPPGGLSGTVQPGGAPSGPGAAVAMFAKDPWAGAIMTGQCQGLKMPGQCLGVRSFSTISWNFVT